MNYVGISLYQGESFLYLKHCMRNSIQNFIFRKVAKIGIYGKFWMHFLRHQSIPSLLFFYLWMLTAKVLQISKFRKRKEISFIEVLIWQSKSSSSMLSNVNLKGRFNMGVVTKFAGEIAFSVLISSSFSCFYM